MTSQSVQAVPAGWQVVLADLSLILFLATASAVAGQPPAASEAGQIAPPQQQIFSSLATGEDIGEWLAQYARDPRERLRITIQYRKGEFSNALKRAETAEISASGSGHQPLITLEEDQENRTTATFAFDGATEQLARGLQ